jgi:hypothetical protein
MSSSQRKRENVHQPKNQSESDLLPPVGKKKKKKEGFENIEDQRCCEAAVVKCSFTRERLSQVEQ